MNDTNKIYKGIGTNNNVTKGDALLVHPNTPPPPPPSNSQSTPKPSNNSSPAKPSSQNGK